MLKTWSQVDLIREAFHYQSRFDGSTMVFKIDFPVTEGPLFPSLVKDLALLAQTGFRVVIIPGAKERIDEVLRQYGISSRYISPSEEDEKIGNGGSFKAPLRITTGEAMPFVEMAAFNVAARFMTALSGSRVDAVVGNFVRGRGLGIVDGISMEHTGTVDKFYADSLKRVLNLGMVPILPCIGWSPSGKPYNVPSDEIALEAVTHLGAVKLFIISLSGGLKGDLPVQTEGLESGHSAGSSDGNSYRNSLRLTLQEAERILDHHRNAPWSKPLAELDLALRASRAGVERVHLIDGAEEGAILKELFSNLGTGIMIYGDEYESIRPIRSKDIPDILRLMEPLMRQGILLKRTGEDIQQKKGDYAVFVIDGQIHACGALHNWGEGQGEIAALATDSAWADRGLGSRMVRYFLARAEKAKLHRVFVLTTRTHDWFESLGFKEVPLESLPERKRMAYDRHRRSAIFALDLQEFSPP